MSLSVQGLIKPSAKFVPILKQTLQGWLDDNAARLGAALAFYSILSLGPLLLFALAMASYVWGHDAARGRIAGEITQLVGQSGAEAIQNILNASSQGHDGLLATLFGFAMLLFSASGAFGELQSAMNIIWKVKPQEGTPVGIIIRNRLFSFLMVMGSGVMLMVSFFISTLVSALSGYLDSIVNGAAIIGHMLDIFSSLLVISFLFGATFKFVPDVFIPWRHVRLAAVFTAILFILGKIAIAFYLSHTGVASSYGAAGSVVILLIWIYYSSQIIFFGAEFAYAYAQQLQKAESGNA